MTELIETIRRSVIGENRPISTPFGEKPLVYADYTASGRSLSFIEDFIRDKVLPVYANTHTEASYTGAQTTILREQARGEIAQSINASDEDVIIFCGSGATAAIDRLIHILGLRLPEGLSERYSLLSHIPEDQRPVVFVGPYEHHSNELPWRESIADVVSIPLAGNGTIDIDVLERELIAYRNRPLKIGSFSAASNVTGIKTEINIIAGLLRQHDALSFWDYAAAGPYVEIDMHPHTGDSQDCGKDAVFISPHKFIGGPGTPGVLVVNKRLIKNKVPAVVGGGTVVYVTPEDHCFTDNLERREEGGTPAIIESIRAGLVFKLQRTVGAKTIEELEDKFLKIAFERFAQQANIEILGNQHSQRLSIVSFNIKHGEKKLHYNFVVALLNDLFGVQARGGCSCAGPYGHSLLGLDMPTSKAIEERLLVGQSVLRPGWVRINFNYFISEDTLNYIVEAVALIAEHGWRLLPYYQFDSTSGLWCYQAHRSPLPTDLADLDFLASANTTKATTEQADYSFDQRLKQGQQELLKRRDQLESYELHIPGCCSELCWFVLPQDIR